MKSFKKLSLYLAMLMISSSGGSTNFSDRDVTQAQPDANNIEQNYSKLLATQPHNVNFVGDVKQNVYLSVSSS